MGRFLEVKGENMYAFKVFVSTLILMMVIMLTGATFKASNQSGKSVAYIIIVINALSLVAIWG